MMNEKQALAFEVERQKANEQPTAPRYPYFDYRYSLIPWLRPEDWASGERS